MACRAQGAAHVMSIVMSSVSKYVIHGTLVPPWSGVTCRGSVIGLRAAGRLTLPYTLKQEQQHEDLRCPYLHELVL